MSPKNYLFNSSFDVLILRIIILLPFILSITGTISWAKPIAEEFVNEPEDCFQKKSYPCAMRSLKKGSVISYSGGSLYLGDKSSVLLFGATTFRFIAGRILVEAHESTKIGIGFGEVLVKGHLWLEKEEGSEKIFVKALMGDVFIENPKISFKETLPAGFEDWYDSIDSKGRVYKGVPKPIDLWSLRVFLAEWIGVQSFLSEKDVINKIAQYKETWSGNVEQASYSYGRAMGKWQAAIEARQLERFRREKAERDEKNFLKKLYRKRFAER